jgi:sirohydrochlorin cobaltochelatase
MTTPSSIDAIIVFAHGSRDPQWRKPVEAVAARIAERSPGLDVRCAYLELCEPDLPTAFAATREANLSKMIARNADFTMAVRIFPLFFGVGKHAREDLPALVAELRAKHPNCRFELTPSAGEFDAVLEAAASAALSPTSA